MARGEGTYHLHLACHGTWIHSHLSQDDEAVSVEQVPSLDVIVIATPMTLDANAALPDYGEPQPYPDITAGQLGGQSSP